MFLRKKNEQERQTKIPKKQDKFRDTIEIIELTNHPIIKNFKATSN